MVPVPATKARAITTTALTTITQATTTAPAIPATATTADPDRPDGARTTITIAGMARDGGIEHQIMWFYQNHPEWAAMDSSWLNEDGDYDNDNNWHNAYWWHQNNPDFFYANHPNWISWHPNWRNEDGAYDGQHNWHYGQWWYNQNPNWVSSQSSQLDKPAQQLGESY